MRSVFAISAAIALFASSALANNADFEPVNFVAEPAAAAPLSDTFVTFRWKGEEAVAKESFDLNVENGARIQVTDFKNRGDMFEVFDNGVSLGMTTKVDAVKDEQVFAATPEEALKDDRFSKGVFDLAKGAHKITIKAMGPYEAGTAAIRVLDYSNVAFHKKGGNDKEWDDDHKHKDHNDGEDDDEESCEEDDEEDDGKDWKHKKGGKWHKDDNEGGKWDHDDKEEGGKWDHDDKEEGGKWHKDDKEGGKWDHEDKEEGGKWHKDDKEGGKWDHEDKEEGGKWHKDDKEGGKWDHDDKEEGGKWGHDDKEGGEWDHDDKEEGGKWDHEDKEGGKWDHEDKEGGKWEHGDKEEGGKWHKGGDEHGYPGQDVDLSHTIYLTKTKWVVQKPTHIPPIGTIPVIPVYGGKEKGDW